MQASDLIGVANRRTRASIWQTIFFLPLLVFTLWLSWKLSGNRTETCFEQGRRSLGAGDWNAAITQFTKVIETDPKFSAAYVNRAMAERELGQYDKAISDCDKALQFNPRDYFAFMELGLSEAAQGNPEKAIEDYLHAAQISPTNSYAFNEMGMADSQRSDFSDAIACLTHAIKLDDHSAGAYDDRGWVEFQKGEFASSIADATHSIQLNPRLGFAYGTRGWARYGMGDVAGAVEDCKRATQLLKPGSAPFFHDQGLLDFVAGDYKKAIVDWQDAIGREPDLKEELLPWIEKAKKCANSSSSPTGLSHPGLDFRLTPQK